MPKEAMFTLKLEPELRDEFMAAAQATHHPASQLVREFMRDFVKQQREASEHDSWFRAEVEQALREAADPAVQRIPNEDIAAKWRQQRAILAKRLGEPAE